MHFVYGGTSANVLAISALLPSSTNAVICSSLSHLFTSECGAPEKFLGAKLLAVAPNDEAKLTPSLIDASLFGVGDEHSSQPLVVSITQSTEYGTVYSLDELAALRRYCDERRLLLHIGL